MTQSSNSINQKIVAFECRDTSSSNLVGSGTAFWAVINGGTKLVTARHIPWNFTTTVSTPTSLKGDFTISWSMSGGMNGCGEAVVHAHPRASGVVPDYDYAWIEFNEPREEPPGKCQPFQISSATPKNGDIITAFGFPGRFGNLQTPRPTSGIFESIDCNAKIGVCGTAQGGHSGGPAFECIGYDTFGDSVIGLMCGQPPTHDINKMGCADLFVLESAKNFS